jgi:hypothetical protein
MSDLAIVSVAVGALIIASRLPGLIAPARFRAHMVKFPRSLLWGKALAGLAAAIAWWHMYQAATDEWAWARPWVLVGMPAAYALVWTFPPHYLAMRGAAALMLLLAKVMVDAADRSEAPARLVVTTLAYGWVVAAIWMAIAPHHFRDWIGWTMASDRRCRAACSVGLAVGVTLIGLGLFVY